MQILGRVGGEGVVLLDKTIICLDFTSDFVSKERIRSRKQKHGEPFGLFYDAVVSLLDKSSVKMDDIEVLEILENNLLPEGRQLLLYQPIHSVSHLRKLVQMESFQGLGNVSCTCLQLRQYTWLLSPSLRA